MTAKHDAEAIALGAAWAAIDTVLDERYGYPWQRIPFAQCYFNDNNEEVAHVLIGLFDISGEMMTFSPPRKWDQLYLSNLIERRKLTATTDEE